MESEVTSTTNQMAESVTNPASTRTDLMDSTTSQLVRIWQELLNVESIGVDQNYFDLGGDSVLAVRLFAHIETAFHIKLPLATLFEAPTIQELAQILRNEAPSSDWSPLVAIQPSGSRPPFFCIHGAGGSVLIYRELALHLGDDQPVYGLQAQGLDGASPPLTKIEDMAALYVKHIRKLHPEGPYLIGGYCMGGTIAYEVAQQLQSEGGKVALLALFDTMDWSKIPPPTIWSKAYRAWQRLVFHVASFLSMDSHGRAQFFTDKSSPLRWRGMLLGRMNKPSLPGISDDVLGQLWGANQVAIESYVPKPFPGVITDFRPMKQYRMFDRSDAKWDRLALKGQEMVILPVYPNGMLLDPYVQHLAAALRKSIDGTIGK